MTAPTVPPHPTTLDSSGRAVNLLTGVHADPGIWTLLTPACNTVHTLRETLSLQHRIGYNTEISPPPSACGEPTQSLSPTL